MKKITVYLLSLFLALTVGGAFHHHELLLYSVSNEGFASISAHDCSNHSNHSDISQPHRCLHCSRISSSLMNDSGLYRIGEIFILDELRIFQYIKYKDAEYLKIIKPRSPPSIA
jgi:hypothetical protein